MGKINLFPDQEATIENIRSAMCRTKNVLLQFPTGGGKSVIASELVGGATKKGKRSWFVAPRRELIRQLSETFTDLEIPHSFIAAGKHYDVMAQNKICSLETLKRRLGKETAPDLAIIDETHYGDAGLDSVMQYLKANGTYILGLSATPWKLSGKGLGCWYDEMVKGPSVKWLIENKRLSEFRAFAPDIIDLSGVGITGGDYNKASLSSRMESDRVLVGNVVDHYKKHASGLRGVTFGVSIAHSQLLAQTYRDSGIPAVHMDGETPEEDRIRYAKAFAKREILQICNAELLTFGYDLASASGDKNATIEVMSDCQPTISIAKQWQKNGRVLRYDIKPHLIFDHANNIMTHGRPDKDMEWSLEDRIKGKKKESKERTVQVTRCDYCFYTAPSFTVCPNCGKERDVSSREIDSVDGELKELTDEEIEFEKKKSRMEVGKARTLDDLWRIQKERGYKPGWVFTQAKIKGIHK